MKIISTNRKALFNYEIITKFEAGIVLLGYEVKSLRNNCVNISNSYITYSFPFIYILNMNISDYANRYNKYNPIEESRTRILLLKKNEINKIKKAQMLKQHTIIPLSIYFNDKNLIKIEIAIAKGKTLVDKREDLKKKDLLF